MSARLRMLVLFAFISVPASASAQPIPAPVQVQKASTAGPRVAATATAVRQLTQVTDKANTALAERKNVGRPVALMIVGGAAIVVGAVIGGTVGTLFMIGGAVAGLYGLYQYLQ